MTPDEVAAAGVAPLVARPFDPRPVLVDGPAGPLVAGGQCAACGHPSAAIAPRCARCAGPMVDALFGPDGVVWSTTTIHVDCGDRRAPYTLAYVDLDNGPRLLAHVADGPTARMAVAARVRLVSPTIHGDPQVAVI